MPLLVFFFAWCHFKGLRCNREIVRAAVACSGLALCWAAPALQADRDIVETAVRQNPKALQFSAPLLRDGDSGLQAIAAAAVAAQAFALNENDDAFGSTGCNNEDY
jgi:hypothetical protein